MTRTQFFICIFVILALGIMGVGEAYRGHAISALRAGQAELAEGIAVLEQRFDNTDRRIDNLAAALGQPMIEQGLSSWYGDREHGNLTANGEIFSRHAMTAAHKKAAFGTLCVVEDLRSGRRVLVRLNDRGPFWEGRIIDLSEKAAHKLGMIHAGVVPVRVYLITSAISIARPGTGD